MEFQYCVSHCIGLRLISDQDKIITLEESPLLENKKSVKQIEEKAVIVIDTESKREDNKKRLYKNGRKREEFEERQHSNNTDIEKKKLKKRYKTVTRKQSLKKNTTFYLKLKIRGVRKIKMNYNNNTLIQNSL